MRGCGLHYPVIHGELAGAGENGSTRWHFERIGDEVRGRHLCHLDMDYSKTGAGVVILNRVAGAPLLS
ncbi:hypothetical protein Rhe02_70960 [Rhizocola hellebori]|uniref:Uncharacterized protein n=1 Tax=Rhizocola hellebori TaxID=1392758 RepID=A0A8J3QDY9_9ACTN|nr:hypothetical protein Rhe02_70960 [Rhizocola hellebori]